MCLGVSGIGSILDEYKNIKNIARPFKPVLGQFL